MRKLIYSVLMWFMMMAQSDAAELSKCLVPSGSASIPIFLDNKASSGGEETSFGVNVIYTVDDAGVWQSGLAQKLRQLGIGSLRFPGGEVADSYDWARSGEDLEMKKNLSSAPIDFKTFLEYAKVMQVSNIYFVVNLEGAFRTSGDRREANIRAYADKAAAWVAEAKQLGSHVKYWEIGNESYLAGTTYPLKAEEYAHALNIFSKAMRAADSSIRIVANGPGNIRAQGFADTLPEDQLTLFRNNRGRLCGDLARKECAQSLKGGAVRAEGKDGWWGEVVRIAPNGFDDVAIHTYDMVNLKGKDGGKFKNTDKIVTLKQHLTRLLGRPVGVAVTEWNVPPTRRGGKTGSQAILSNAIKLGNFMAAGVQDAVFWPLRYPSEEESDRALLSMDGLEEQPMYRAFDLMNSTLRGKFVSQELIDEGVYVLRTRNAEGESVMMVNANPAKKNVALDYHRKSSSVQIDQLSGDLMEGGALCSGPVSPKGVGVVLPAKSITVTRFMY